MICGLYAIADCWSLGVGVFYCICPVGPLSQHVKAERPLERFLNLPLCMSQAVLDLRNCAPLQIPRDKPSLTWLQAWGSITLEKIEMREGKDSDFVFRSLDTCLICHISRRQQAQIGFTSIIRLIINLRMLKYRTTNWADLAFLLLMVVMYNSLIIYKGPTLPDPYRAPTTRSNNLLKVWSQLIVDGFVFITEGFVRAVWTDHNDTGLLQPRKHDSLMPAHFHRPIHKCPQHKMSPVVEYLFRLAPDLSRWCIFGCPTTPCWPIMWNTPQISAVGSREIGYLRTMKLPLLSHIN